MILLETEKGIFSYRVIGVAIHKDRILLHKSEIGEYWSLPGGRCELLESSEEAIQREMEEELHSTAKVGELLCFNENFFAIRGKPFHEIGLYYAIRFPKDAPIWAWGEEFDGPEKSKKRPVKFRWFKKKDLKKLDLRPPFIREFFKEKKRPLFLITRDVGI